jgi:hypothetical protein
MDRASEDSRGALLPKVRPIGPEGERRYSTPDQLGTGASGPVEVSSACDEQSYGWPVRRVRASWVIQAAITTLGMAALLCSCATTGRRSPSTRPTRQEFPTTAPDDVEATLVLLLYWRKQADEVKAHITDITDRSNRSGPTGGVGLRV